MTNGYRCPNCSYSLVLLEGRRKFKCAKCGKLFHQKQIEDESFRRWNERMRELEKHNLKIKEKKKLTDEEKRQKRNDYYEKNKKRLREKAQEWRDKKREHYNGIKKSYYHNNLEYSRHLMRIKHWRRKQALLVETELELKNPIINLKCPL